MTSYLESKNNPNDEKGSVEESLKTESNNGNHYCICFRFFIS